MSLTRIIGAVKDLKVGGVAYEDVVFSDAHRYTGGAAAVGAVLLDQVANAAILANSVTSGAEIPMTGFSCLVNGMKVRGAFYKIGFFEDEIIEFIGEEVGGEFITVAARSNSQKIIWTIPYHDCGDLAHRKSILKWGIIFSIFGAAVMGIINLIVFKFSPSIPLIYRLLPSFLVFVIVFFINYWARSHFAKFSKNATLIFAALGFTEPREVNLQEAHDRADKEFIKANGGATPMVTPWCYRF